MFTTRYIFDNVPWNQMGWQPIPLFVKTFVEMSEGLLSVINSHATSRTRIVPSGHDAYSYLLFQCGGWFGSSVRRSVITAAYHAIPQAKDKHFRLIIILCRLILALGSLPLCTMLFVSVQVV